MVLEDMVIDSITGESNYGLIF